MTRDPLVRRFISLCLFAGAFVWVAVEFFDVEWRVIREFFLGSIALVVILIVLAWLASLILRRLGRRRSDFLDDIEDHTDKRDPD